MKKFSCIFVVFCMLLMQMTGIVFAETEPVTFVATEDFKSFYDNGINSSSGANPEFLASGVLLRGAGEWLSFDVSALASGTYKVSASYCATVATNYCVHMDVLVDDVISVKKALSITGTGWFDPSQTAEIGNIYVDGAQEIKIKNSGTYPFILENLTLTYVGADDTTADIVLDAQNVAVRADENNSNAYSKLSEDYWDEQIQPAPAEGQNYVYGTQFDEQGLAHYPISHNNIYQNGALVSHVGDWVKYDISNFKAGTYEITVNYANKADTNIVFGSLGTTLPKTDANSYGVYKDAVIGQIYIKDSDDRLMLKNVSGGSTYFETFTFKYVSSDRLVFPELSVDAPNVISGGEGVGYHGNSMNNQTPGSLERTGSDVILRQAGEWVKYDVSSLEEGTYRLDLTYTIRKTTGEYLDVYVNDDLALRVKPEITTNTLGGTPDTKTIGEVYLPVGTKTIKINHTGRDVLYMRGFKLTYVKETEPAYAISQYGENVTCHDEASAIITENGVDYYDKEGAAFTSTSVLSGGNLIQHADDWARYDIKGMKPGTYNISFNHASTAVASYKFKIGGKSMMYTETENVLSFSVPLTGGYGTYQEHALGKIYVPEGAEYLIMENASGGSNYISHFDLTYVGAERPSLPVVIAANNVIPGGQGVGYYDSYAAGTLEISGTEVILRQNEWLKYDLSELESGTYEIGIKNSSTSETVVNILSGDSNVIKKFVSSTDSYGTFVDNVIGTIYVSENSSTVTVKNIGTGATFIRNISLTFVSSENTAINRYDFNAEKDLVEGGHGVGYYDGQGESRFEVSGGVVFRQNDWVRYDITNADIVPGVYQVSLTGTTNGNTTMYTKTDSMTAETSAAVVNDGQTVFPIGLVVIKDDTTYVHVENRGTSNRPIITKITLTAVSDETISVKYTSDEAGANEILDFAGYTGMYATIEIVKPQNAQFAAEAIFAIYEGNKLIKADALPITGSYIYKRTIYIDGLSDLYNVKTFIWQDVSGMQPIIEEAPITA